MTVPAGRPALEDVLKDARACKLCADSLPLGPRPIVRMKSSARLLIIGQAPGTKVHESGIPWNDPSGDRLHDWMQVSNEEFYDETKVAIMPMGFCYPGRAPNGGDNPPRPECAPAWHDRLRPFLPDIALTLLVGSYAQKYYLGRGKGRAAPTMTQTVQDHRKYLEDGFLPLPHPSWRTNHWQKKNAWFDQQVLPTLRQQVRAIFA